MHVLRAEKGFSVIGQETDGTVTPEDLGLGWTIARGKPDFVGKRSLTRPGMVRGDRLQLVGLLTAAPDVVLEEGAQVTGAGAMGHVTSAYHSAALNRSIALAVISAGRSRLGTKPNVPMPGGIIEVIVVDPVFYDPDGTRMTQIITISDHTKSTRRLPPTPVDIPFARPCPEVQLTLAPETRKFSVRTDRNLAPTPSRRHSRWPRPSYGSDSDEFQILANEAPSIEADSIVDVSHRTVGLRLTGPRAAWCLNSFCALDLDEFPEDA